MKKKLTIIAMAIVMSTMISCSDNQNQNTEYAEPIYIEVNHDYYENGVVYADSADKSSFLDFESMKTSYLCAIPNCTHTTSSCLANMVGTTPIFYNDSIYYFDFVANVKETPNGRVFYIESKLMKAELESSEVEEVCEFTDCTPNNEYVLMGNILYFVGCDQNPQKDDYGNFTWSDVGGIDYLCSINLDTGKYTNYGIICNVEDRYPAADYSSSSKILGCYNNKIYIGHSFLKEEPRDGKVNNWTLLNFEFDLKTQNLIESNLPYSAYMDNDTYVYYNKDDNATVILDNGNTYIISDCYIDVYAPVYNGKMFLRDGWYYLSDLSKHDLGEYSGEKYSVISYYDNSYIFFDGANSVKLTEEELLALE